MFMRRHVAALLLILLAWANESNASDITRGLSVPLRAGIDSSAGISKKIKLYRGSKALIIGINNYTNGWPKLSMAVEDAHQVAAALEKQGFDVTLKLNPTAVELQSALESFFVVEDADPDVRLFVWYAGHGHTMGKERYLVPAP